MSFKPTSGFAFPTKHNTLSVKLGCQSDLHNIKTAEKFWTKHLYFKVYICAYILWNFPSYFNNVSNIQCSHGNGIHVGNEPIETSPIPLSLC